MAEGYSGHLRKARQISQRVFDSLLISKHRERAALFRVNDALREAFFGNLKEASARADAALDLSREMYVVYGAAVVLALAGDTARAQVLADDLQKNFGEDTTVNYNHLPVLRAILAIKSGEPARAIEQLEIARAVELGTPRCMVHGYFGAMYPVYVRGEAYLALNKGAEAAAEFRKILDHRGIVASDPIGAIARWRAGRALALAGDVENAQRAYGEFFGLWKSADGDLPVLKQAREEFAKSGVAAAPARF
jgi:tetratricopeptide (TPR) repeat protein